jgi:Fic family protein
VQPRTEAAFEPLFVRDRAKAISADNTPIPISSEGNRVRDAVSRSIIDRAPVGYQRELLDRYKPNETFYLPEILIRDLHDLGRSPRGPRPAGTYAREIFDRLLIDLSWSSSRLEGNTYSLLDTKRLIEQGTAAVGKDAKETQMILNHKAAIELLVGSTAEIGINRYTLLNLHALLADNLLDDPREAGRLRQASRAISGSTYIPTNVPQLIREQFEVLLKKGAAIRDPFEQAFFLMVHIPYLQPFVDVNKRTSRLAANIPLVKGNLVPLSFIDVPEQIYVDGLMGIYELNRVELLRDLFVWSYERSSRRYKAMRDSLPEPDTFRLKHRAALIDVIGEIVRRNLKPSRKQVTSLAKPLVQAEDLSAFSKMALDDLKELHEGNIARFRLRPSEFRRWQEK